MKLFSIALFISFFALNMSAQCNLACFNSVVGNLDASCQYELTPADADPTLALSCPAGVFQIQIYDDLNNLIPSSPFVDGSYLGVNLTYTLTDLNTNTLCFGNLTLNDNSPPIVICSSGQEVECIGNNSVIPPTVFDNCGSSPTITLVNQSFSALTCDPNYVGQYLNNFLVTDASGNSSMCFSDVNVKRINLNSIVFPADFTLASNTELNCTNSDDPSVTGYPQFNNQDLVNLDLACNVNVFYTDNVIPGCIEVINRTWTVTELWCGTLFDINFDQRIEKVDTNAPAAVCTSGISADIPASGTLILPASIFDGGSADDCSSSLTFDLIPNTFTCADVGIVNVQLIVYDQCGNSSACNTTVTIMDNSSVCPPPPLFQITGPITESEDFCAGQDIESNACLKPNINVSYTAPVSILLEAGFEVPSSSDFEATINVCF